MDAAAAGAQRITRVVILILFKNYDYKETQKMKNVTIANLVRAETDHMIRAQIKAFGLKFGEITHHAQHHRI